MLSEYTKLTIGDLAIEANWNKEVMPAKKFRFTMGDKVQLVDRDDIYSLLMLFGDEKQQELLIPVKETKVKMIRRLISVRAKKDMKKGEKLSFVYEYPMAVEHYEKLLQNSPNYQSSNKPFDSSILLAKR